MLLKTFINEIGKDERFQSWLSSSCFAPAKRRIYFFFAKKNIYAFYERISCLNHSEFDDDHELYPTHRFLI